MPLLPVSHNRAPLWLFALLTSRSVVAKTKYRIRGFHPVDHLFKSIYFPAIPRPPASGPAIPNASWKSSSFPIKISARQFRKRSDATLPYALSKKRGNSGRRTRVRIVLPQAQAPYKRTRFRGQRCNQAGKVQNTDPLLSNSLSKSKSEIFSVRPTSPARSFVTLGPRRPNPLSAILN